MSLLSKFKRRDAAPTGESERKTALASDIQYREVRIRQDNVNQESRTVELAFSSDTPITRRDFMGPYIEILDHSEKSVRLERLNDGGALLMDHNHRDQIGVIENARVEGGKARATVRFGKSDRAEEIFADVQDGIRSKISVGYRIYAAEEREGENGQPDQVRITDWEPMEISFVSIPADATVGVGRSDYQREHQETTMSKQTPKPAQDEREDEDVTAAGKGGQPAAHDPAGDTDERTEIDKRLRAIGEKFGEKKLAEEVIELGGSVEDLQRQIREKRWAPSAPIRQDDSPLAPRIEQRLQYAGKLRGFENEEQAYRAGMWARSWMFADRQAHQWCKDHGMRVATEGVLTAGGAVVPTEFSSAIIDLREDYGVFRRLVRVHPMTSDVTEIPRRTGGLTAYAVGENPASDITASDKSWDIVSLSAKKWAVLSKFSTDYAEDAIIDVAQDLAQEAAYAFAQKEDECFIDGDGTSTYHGMVGFRTKMVDGSHDGSYHDATAGDDTFGEIIAGDLDAVRAMLPEYAAMMGDVNWVCSKLAKNLVFDAITRAAGGNTQAMLGGSLVDAYLGDEIVVSQAMPKGKTTVYNEVVMLLYGNFKLAATLGDRRSFSFKVLNELFAGKDQIGILGTTRFDAVVHDIGDDTNAGPVVALRGNTS